MQAKIKNQPFPGTAVLGWIDLKQFKLLKVLNPPEPDLLVDLADFW